MKAATYPTYGWPDVIKIRDIDRPVPDPDEVLVRVHAASVNPLDWHMLRGTPRFLRLTEGLFRPKHPVLGADVAGVIVEVGSAVTDLAIGDEVFGEIGSGAIAEFARCPPHRASRASRWGFRGRLRPRRRSQRSRRSRACATSDTFAAV